MNLAMRYFLGIDTFARIIGCDTFTWIVSGGFFVCIVSCGFFIIHAILCLYQVYYAFRIDCCFLLFLVYFLISNT